MEDQQKGALSPNQSQNLLSGIWTIKRVLAWSSEYLKKHSSDTPRLDAEMLLSYALKCPRIDLFIHADKPLLQIELSSFKELLKRRARQEPIAYIIGEKAFMTHVFQVNSSVLVPRPETERLVEIVLDYAGKAKLSSVLEIGFGSGCIALSLAKALPIVTIIAWDNSAPALEVANSNKNQIEAENCHFILKDALDMQNWCGAQDQYFDVLVSNPPYLRESEYRNSLSGPLSYEPKGALVAGEDGLVFYQMLALHSKGVLKPGGRIFLEIGYQQGALVRDMFVTCGWIDVTIHKDLNACDRVLTARYPLA